MFISREKSLDKIQHLLQIKRKKKSFKQTSNRNELPKADRVSYSVYETPRVNILNSERLNVCLYD